MFDIGTQEIIIIFIVALLVFGPKKLPELAKTLGKGIRELKSAMLGVKDTLEKETGFSGDLKESIKESLIKGSPLDTNNKEEKRPGPEKTAEEGGGIAASAENKAESETEKDG
ncbi:MAG: Sec-independent protein translocase protein TatB [Nitrospirota bacterium]